MKAFGTQKIFREEETSSYLSSDLMKVLEKDIDVVCVFYCNSAPIPKRFKIKYRNGRVKTINIDLVKRTEVVNINNLGKMPKVIYTCQSEVEELIINYELIYYIREMRWELYRVG